MRPSTDARKVLRANLMADAGFSSSCGHDARMVD